VTSGDSEGGSGGSGGSGGTKGWTYAPTTSPTPIAPPISPPPGLLGLVDERFKISPPPRPPPGPPVKSPPPPDWANDGGDNHGHVLVTNTTDEVVKEELDFDDGGRLHKDARQQLVEDAVQHSTYYNATSVNDDTEVRGASCRHARE